ncbi:hypothetical protein [Streptomyces sp. NPDC001678]|uniref:hypothetical protein n=1 Tax=Streptomyces sp. NPDC001678 TaxID=3364599 RepID=UPI0036CF5953
MIAYNWSNLRMMFGMASVLWALSFAGVAISNRATPILPQTFSEGCGIAVAALTLAPQFCWLAAVSIALLKAARRAGLHPRKDPVREAQVP